MSGGADCKNSVKETKKRNKLAVKNEKNAGNVLWILTERRPLGIVEGKIQSIIVLKSVNIEDD